MQEHLLLPATASVRSGVRRRMQTAFKSDLNVKSIHANLQRFKRSGRSLIFMLSFKVAIAILIAVSWAACGSVAQKEQPSNPETQQGTVVEPAAAETAGQEEKGPTAAEIAADEKRAAERARQAKTVATYEAIGVLVATGKIDSAITQSEASAAYQNREPDTVLLHANLLMLENRQADAEAELMKLLESDPNDIEALIALALLAGATGDEIEKKSLLVKILELDPFHANALASLGELYLQAGIQDAAEGLFVSALESDTNNIVAILGLASLYMDKKAHEKAEIYLMRAISIEPEFDFAHADMARVKSAQGKYTDAIESYTKAISLQRDYYWHYVDRGKLFLNVGRKEEAIADFVRATKIDAEGFLAHVYLAGIFFDQQSWQKALEHYSNSVRLKKDYYFAYRPLGILYYRVEEWKNATRFLKLAYKQNPRDHTYALLAALAYRKGGDEGRATTLLQELANKLPRESWYYDVARFLLSPAYDLNLIMRIKKEDNRIVKNRITFYLATQYLISGKRRAAAALLIDVANSENPDILEFQIAKWELEGQGINLN